MVYRNVMQREPDQAGYDYWLDQMSKGMTRGDLMIYFSDSPEYRTRASGRVFAVYAVRLLEQREPSAGDVAELVAIFDWSGRISVVEAILDAVPYYDRFWIDGEAAGAGLREAESPPVPPECIDRPSARELVDEFAG